MKVIFSHRISKKEAIGDMERGWLLKAVLKGIFQVIKGNQLPHHSELRKLYITTVIGPRRAVFLVNLQTGDAFFLLFRSKKDPIGENISIKNPAFKNTLHHYLEVLKEDIQNRHFDAYNLGE